MSNKSLKKKNRSLFKLINNDPVLMKRLILLSPIIIYSFLSLAFFAHFHLSGMTNKIFSSYPDTQSFIWFLNWFPYSVIHGLNPFITKYVWYPSGFNLAWSTLVPTPSILLAPFTLIWGAVFSYNLLALTAPILSSLSCFYLVYYITKKYTPSLMSGYIYGFSSYEIGQLLYHTNLYMTFLLPLIVLLYLLRYKAKISRNIFILLLGATMLLEFGISTEVFISTILFSLVTLIFFYIFATKSAKEKIFITTIESVLGIILSLVVLIPYIYYLLVGYSSVPAVINSPITYSSDLLNFVLPTNITLIGHSHFANITSHFLGNNGEQGSYLGIPLILLLIYIAFKYWNKKYFRSLYCSLIVVIICLIGPYLTIRGVKESWMPWNMATHLPVLRSALPDRFSLFMFLIIAVIFGIWLSLKTSKRMSYFKYIVTLISLVFILPTFSLFKWDPISVPYIFHKNIVQKYIPKGSNIVVIPYGYTGNSMLDQYVSGMDFTQSGGYIGITPTPFVQNPISSSLIQLQTDPNFISDLNKFIKEDSISEIIYTPNTPAPIQAELEKVTWNRRTVMGATIIYVPHNLYNNNKINN